MRTIPTSTRHGTWNSMTRSSLVRTRKFSRATTSATRSCSLVLQPWNLLARDLGGRHSTSAMLKETPQEARRCDAASLGSHERGRAQHREWHRRLRCSWVSRPWQPCSRCCCRQDLQKVTVVMFVCFWLDGVQEGVISVDLRNAYDMRLG